MKDGKIDMCQALKELIAEGRSEGIRSIVVNMVNLGMNNEEIRKIAACNQELIDEVHRDIGNAS